MGKVVWRSVLRVCRRKSVRFFRAVNALLYGLGVIAVPHLLALDLLVWVSCRDGDREGCSVRLSTSLARMHDVEAVPCGHCN